MPAAPDDPHQLRLLLFRIASNLSLTMLIAVAALTLRRSKPGLDS